MRSEWDVAPVGKYFDLINGFAFKSRDFLDSGTPAIKIKNIKAGNFQKDGMAYVSPDFLHSKPDKVARPLDLLISMSGNRHDGSPETWVGKVALFNDPEPHLINQRVGLLRVKNDAPIDPCFASYQLSSLPYQQLFIAIATSSGGQANLSPKQILGADFAFPPLPQQRAIAGVLGSLDDKIELNRRMNRTLEAMARALFMSWFVDFDPVHANAAGEPSLPPDLAALFPSAFESSTLGEVPEGWEVKSLADVVEIRSGGTPARKKPEYWNGDIPWFSIKDAPADGDVWVVETEEHTTAEGIERSAANVLPLRTTIISARGTVGKLALTGVPMAMNQSCYGLVATPGCPPYYKHFLTQQVVERLQKISHGGVFDTITKQTFAAVDVVVPPEVVAAAFEEAVAPLLEKQQANLRESLTLAALRDALLPKLLSGELDVSTVGTEA